MEFKAKKIEVPPENPFEHDRLDRKPDVENLSLLLRNISSPIVLSVNAPWGAGKTTFLEMLRADLASKDCKSIYFNAWETDFASDPLLAFLGEMNQGLKSFLDEDEDKSWAWEQAKKAGVHILKKEIPALVKGWTAGVIDTENLMEDLIDEYSKNKDAIASFKENVKKILENSEGGPTKLYIFVDELDRCRPTYAIELLERIKHLLSVEGLVFILSLDKEQLAHSVKSIYGADFEARGYLRRFIDIEYTLRVVELDNFIDQLYQTFDFKSFFEARSQHPGFRDDAENLKNVFKLLAKSKQLSLREVEQLFAKVNLVFHSTDENVYIYPSLLAFLLVAKEYHADVYQNYIRKEGLPEGMIECLHSMLPESERLESFECMLIEGFLIAAKHSRHDSKTGGSIEMHKKIISDEKNSDESKWYSDRVINIAEKPIEMGTSLSLSSIVERIEMSGQFKFES